MYINNMYRSLKKRKMEKIEEKMQVEISVRYAKNEKFVC